MSPGFKCNCQEKWRATKGGEYEVSSKGRVRNPHTGKFLTVYYGKCGYGRVMMKHVSDIPLKIHRLVARAFIPNPDNLKTVDHDDEDKTNNCVCNLGWMDHRDNAIKSSQRTYKVLSPTGEEFIVTNLKDFCKDIPPNAYNLYSVAAGKRTHSHGWKAKKVNI